MFTTAANEASATVQIDEESSAFDPPAIVLVPRTGEYLLVTERDGTMLTVTRGFAKPERAESLREGDDVLQIGVYEDIEP